MRSRRAFLTGAAAVALPPSLAASDRVAMLRGGELIAHGAPREVLTRERLCELYGVDVEVVEALLADGTRRQVCLTAGR